LKLDLDATNPNSFGLAVRSVTAQVRLDKQYDMGKTTISQPIDLPAKATTAVTVPLSIPWSNLAPLLALATSNKDVAYEVQGTATIGGSSLNVDVPFTASGTIAHDEILRATARSIPAIPGLTAPPR
jgi:LEA14-like dessication related protein